MKLRSGKSYCFLKLLQRLKPSWNDLGSCLVRLLPCGEGVMMGVVLMIPKKEEVLKSLVELVFLLCELFLQVGFNLGVTWSTKRWSTWQGTDTAVP